MAPNSPVQDRALEYLDMLDEVAQNKARMDMVRGLLASPLARMEQVRSFFPEYFDPFEAAKTEDGGYDIDQIDDSQVEWKTAGSHEEDEALSAWIDAHEEGSFTGDEISD